MQIIGIGTIYQLRQAMLSLQRLEQGEHLVLAMVTAQAAVVADGGNRQGLPVNDLVVQLTTLLQRLQPGYCLAAVAFFDQI